jgi:hypothetical protein
MYTVVSRKTRNGLGCPPGAVPAVLAGNSGFSGRIFIKTGITLFFH